MATIKYHVSAATFYRRFGFAPCTCYERPVAALYDIRTVSSHIWDSCKKEYLVKEVQVECSECRANKIFTEREFEQELYDSDIDCL